MIKKIIVVLIVVAILYAGWYFVSPLFINDVVDEAFPGDFGELPTEEEIANMTEEERMEMEMKFLEMAEKMPDTVIDDEMPGEELVMEENPEAPVGNEDETSMPAEGEVPASGPVELYSGMFRDADSFHKGSGDATIYRLEDGSRVLRFEDFSVTNGPDLHVLLVKNSNPENRGDVQEGYIDLGKLKGNKGNQNYEIPGDIDVDEYGSIVIYCEPFHVVFSVASLSN